MSDLYELVQTITTEATAEIARGSDPLAVAHALRTAAHAVEYALMPERGGRRVADEPGVPWAGDRRWYPGHHDHDEPPVRLAVERRGVTL